MPKKTSTDLRRQVGQLLILGFDGIEIDAALHNTLASLQPGGVILFARNIEEPTQTWKLLRDCQATSSYPLFLCVDLEGGTVDRLRKVIAPAPSVERVFATGNRKLWRMHGQILGLEARAIGFNTDFAPVFDLGLPASRSVLTSRTASPSAKEVVAYSKEFLRGLKASKVLGCGKHFPGLGEAHLDSHKEMPVVHRSWKQMWAEDLLPYRQLHRDVPLVMVAHAAYPEVTKDNLPASLSKHWMTDVLRKKIGYRGMILSDDLEMGGVLSAGPIEEVSVETLRAGADMFLVCHNLELVERAYAAVLKEAEGNRRFAAQVARAASRVLSFKKRSPALRGFAAEPKARVVQNLKKIVERFSEMTAWEESSLRIPEASA